MQSMRSLIILTAAMLLVSFGAALAADAPSRVMPLDDPGEVLQVIPPPVAAGPASAAATYNVPADFATIQAAIDAAASGDVITVDAGTYNEAILINAKNLTITGAGAGSAIIAGTGAVTQYIVRITGGAVVDLSGFTIDGTGIDRQYGIYADAGSDGDIHDNEVKNVSWPGAAGIAIRRQECYIDVTNNTVYGFGRIGIYTRDDVILNTDTGVISGNTVTGLGGSDPDRLSYGISVYSGNPTIDGNDIYDCVSGANVAVWASAGMDIWTGSTSVVSNNNFFNNDYGIISNSASPAMSGNTFSGTTYDDVRLDYFVKGNPTPHWAEYYNTIQAAINAIPATSYPVIVWIGVYSGGGTYAEAVNVNKSCEIYGDTRATVIVNPVGFAVNNSGIYIDADNVGLYSVTLASSNASSLPRYGIKFGARDGCVLEDAEVRNCYRTGIDILGATNLAITDVESKDNGGNGLQMTDAANVALTGLTTSGNAWGGVGIFTWGQYTPIGTSGVVFAGTNSFGETATPSIGGIYLEEGNFADPMNPYPITFSTNIGDGADVTLQLADVTHFLSGNSDNNNAYKRFYQTLADAQATNGVAVSHITDGRYIKQLDGSNVYVPGDPGYLGSIQNAVDAADPGDVVHIAAGTFQEQVEVAKTLTLDGEGSTTVILSPAVLTKSFTTSTTNKPVVYVHDASPVEVHDLVIDGNGAGNANVRFSGIAFRNAGGGIYDCEVTDVRDTPFSGAQHGVAIYAYNDDMVTRHIDVHGCNVHDFQKNAMALNSGDTTVLTVDVDGNIVTGYGATTVTAQNGIQVYSDLGSGTISNNTVNDIAYDNTANPIKYVATSILNFYTDVDITGNTVGGQAHVGVYNIDGSGDITGNVVGIQKIGVYAFGILATDPPGAVPSPFTESTEATALPAHTRKTLATTQVVNVSGNDVSFSGVDNTATYGIEADAGWGPDDIAFTGNNNTVTGFEVGFEFYQCESGCDTGVFTSIVANYNDVSGNTLFGMRSNASYLTANGLSNWWGDATGPYNAALNPGGLGVPVSPYIDFDPWMTGPSMLSVSPSYGITNCSTAMAFDVRLDHAGIPPQVRGVDVDVQIPTAIASATTGDFVEGPVLGTVGNPTYFAVLDNGGGSFTINTAILGGSTGATASDVLFTLTLHPTTAGTGSIALSGLQLRDPNNVALPGGVADGTLQVDCTVPTMEWPLAEAEGACYNAAPTFANFGFDDDVNLDLAEYKIDGGGWTTIFSGIDALSYDDDGWMLPGFGALGEGAHTVFFRVKDDAGNWNGEGTPDTYSWGFVKDTVPPSPPTAFVALPGNNKTHLSWTNPGGDFVGVEIRAVGWADYPEYGTPGPVAPAYPANETEGFLVAQVTGGGSTFDDNPRAPRDIYYYAAFAYDCAGNYSALGATAKDRTTSYWLGDIQPNPAYDGNVSIADLAAFSATFGESDGDAGWNNEADWGPTDDFSRFGIPLPDNTVDFEDLMIIAMNYGNVTPAGMPASAPADVERLSDLVTLRLEPRERDGRTTTYAVVMNSAARTLKGVSAVLDAGVGGRVTAVRASGITNNSSVFFGTIERNGRVELCTAALGVDQPLTGSGVIAEIEIDNDLESPARIQRAVLRDVSNRSDEIAAPPPVASFVPTVTSMSQNVPNPFNPVTTVQYDVAIAGNVSIVIYDVAGRLVRTLVDTHQAPGRYTAQWNGTDDRGNPVGSGVYFYRMTAASYQSSTRKMLLLK